MSLENECISGKPGATVCFVWHCAPFSGATMKEERQVAGVPGGTKYLPKIGEPVAEKKWKEKETEPKCAERV